MGRDARGIAVNGRDSFRNAGTGIGGSDRMNSATLIRVRTSVELAVGRVPAVNRERHTEPIAGIAHADDAIVEVFNSNPLWIATTDDFAGKTRYDRSDVDMFLWNTTMGEGSTCLEARVAGHDGPAGVVAWMAPHLRDQCPWIAASCFMPIISAKVSEAKYLRAVEQLLAAAGWERVRASPLLAQPWARVFLQSLGYTPIGERLDQDKRRCMVMEKWLITNQQGRQHDGFGD